MSKVVYSSLAGCQNLLVEGQGFWRSGVGVCARLRMRVGVVKEVG